MGEMSERRLPHVSNAILQSITATMGTDDTQLQGWVQKVAYENPEIAIAVDAMGIKGGLLIAALVYKMLDSQAEADSMNEEFQ